MDQAPRPNYVRSLLPPNRAGSQPQLRHWKSFPLTFGYKVDGTYSEFYKSAVDQALGNWDVAIQHQLGTNIFVLADPGEQPQVTFEFRTAQDAADELGKSTRDLYGDTFNQVDNEGNLTRSNVVLITQVGQTFPMPADILEGIAEHEIGHVLGIEGHSPYPTDIMFVQRDGDPVKQAISEADVNTLWAAYCGP